MAQLNDTMVQGDLRVTGKIYGTDNAIRLENANLAIPTLNAGDYVGSTGDFFIGSGSGKNLPDTTNNFNIHATVTHFTGTTYRLSQIATPTSSTNPSGIYERGGSSTDGATWTFGSWASTTTDTLVKATAKSDNAEYKLLATASASPTSGASTEAVYDTDITLNPSTNTISASLARTFASSSSSTVPETPIITVSGSTDGFKLTYGATTADLGITKFYTTDDANAKLSFGNIVSSTYKEALVITNGSATLNGTATYANLPVGFAYNRTSIDWGTLTSGNGYTLVTVWVTDSAEIVFAKKSGALSVQIDGVFYQREGLKRVLDTSDLGNSIPIIEHVTAIPSNPTVGTIYAL